MQLRIYLGDIASQVGLSTLSCPAKDKVFGSTIQRYDAKCFLVLASEKHLHKQLCVYMCSHKAVWYEREAGLLKWFWKEIIQSLLVENNSKNQNNQQKKPHQTNNPPKQQQPAKTPLKTVFRKKKHSSLPSNG